MARPHKATVDYFPHICDTENGKTLTVLQNKYGNDGYAFWFRMLEFLGKRDGLYFNYNNPADLEFLCAKTHQKDTETLLHILADLDILGAIDHELYQEKIIWCQNFVDGVADAFKRSVSGVPRRPTPKTVNVGKTDVSVGKMGESADILHTETPKNNTETTQKKLKEIKEYNPPLVPPAAAPKENDEKLLPATAEAEFLEYVEETKGEFPDLDCEAEFKKFNLYWLEGRRKLKRPKLAWRNWLEKARQIKNSRKDNASEKRQEGAGGNGSKFKSSLTRPLGRQY